jgi:phosphoglycerol transferase MdoB-like AlkP superfamily enzyme
VIIGLRLWGKEKFQKVTWKNLLFRGLATVAGAGMVAISFVSYYPLKAADKYDEMINGTAEKSYATYGVIGNMFGEYASSLIKDESRLTDEEISNFIYEKLAPTTPYTGVAKDKNVVMILAESFEWFTFLGHLDNYPRAQELGLTEEKLREIFPTLWKFYDTWLVATNYHSREKTDISETLSLLGSYPTTGYINYNYQNNTLPHTVPSILGEACGDNITVRSYHNNYKTFYNRHIEHQTFGFEKSVFFSFANAVTLYISGKCKKYSQFTITKIEVFIYYSTYT